MIYLLTGPAGVGKSTVSKLIAENLPKSCLIEGDDVYNIVIGGHVSPWKEGNQLGLFWKNSFDMIENCIEENFDVVFNYILSKEDVANIRARFPKEQIKFVVLLVDEKTIVARDKLRPLDCQMGERSVVLLREMLEENFDSSNILDTTALSAEQTFLEILKNNRFLI